MPTKGLAAPETKAAFERARLLIEQAQAIGERPDDPLLLFSVLYGFCVANWSAFNGRLVRELAEQFFALAEQDGRRSTNGRPPPNGGRLLHRRITRGRAHFDQALMLYDPAKHRSS